LGPWVLPYICGNIANFRLNGIDIDISGVGGNEDGADLIRILLSGASSAQSCGQLWLKDLRVVGDWLEFLVKVDEQKRV